MQFTSAKKDCAHDGGAICALILYLYLNFLFLYVIHVHSLSIYYLFLPFCISSTWRGYTNFFLYIIIYRGHIIGETKKRDIMHSMHTRPVHAVLDNLSLARLVIIWGKKKSVLVSCLGVNFFFIADIFVSLFLCR